jgi:hypothetical protein
MSTIWLPFGHADMIQVDTSITQDATGNYTLAVRCLENRLGDIARFCITPGTPLFWVATPLEDDAVPLYPTPDATGTSRIDRIKAVCEDLHIIQKGLQAILAELDEYIRTRVILNTMVPAESYVI